MESRLLLPEVVQPSPPTWADQVCAEAVGLAPSSPVALLLSFPLTLLHIVRTYGGGARGTAAAQGRAFRIHMVPPKGHQHADPTPTLTENFRAQLATFCSYHICRSVHNGVTVAGRVREGDPSLRHLCGIWAIAPAGAHD